MILQAWKLQNLKIPHSNIHSDMDLSYVWIAKIRQKFFFPMFVQDSWNLSCLCLLRSVQVGLAELKDRRRLEIADKKNDWMYSRPVLRIGEDLDIADLFF